MILGRQLWTIMKALLLKHKKIIRGQELLQIIFQVTLDQANWIMRLILIDKFLDGGLILDLRNWIT